MTAATIQSEDWIKEPEAAGIVKMVRGDDGVEAFRHLNNRIDPHKALTKSQRIKAIQKFPGLEWRQEECRRPGCAGQA